MGLWSKLFGRGTSPERAKEPDGSHPEPLRTRPEAVTVFAPSEVARKLAFDTSALKLLKSI